MNFHHLKLSDHFTLGEFVCQGKTCCCHGAVIVDEKLTGILEEIRSLTGGPVSVTCGYRCDVHNKEVGGHVASFHRVGMAADITSFILREDLESWAIRAGSIVESTLGPDGGNVIWYPKRKFIHVDVGHRIAALVREKE